MTKGKHTPTPWHVGKGGDCHTRLYANEDAICVFGQGTDEDAVDYPREKQNAAFIVSAVNCHDELVGCLKDFIRCVERNENVERPAVSIALDGLRSLLKKAKGDT